MDKSYVVLFIILFSFDVIGKPSCEYFPNRNYVWASSYEFPQRPSDSLIENCPSGKLTDPTICEQISDSMSDSEKKQLVLDGLVRDNGFPGFAQSDDWNSEVSFKKYPPDGVQARSKGSIRDAWLKIVSISPSVFDSSSGQLFVNSSGKARTEFGFSIVVEKETFPLDCKTEYDVCGNNYSLQTYNNGQYLDNQNRKEVFFETYQMAHNSSGEITSLLHVNTGYLIHHYALAEHCIQIFNQTQCIHTCDYSHSEERKSELVLTDSLRYYRYSFVDFSKSIIDFHENNLAKGWIFLVSNEDFNNMLFTLDNALLRIQSRQYQFRSDYAPYNILTPEVKKNPNKMQVRDFGILYEDERVLSGEEFDEFLSVTEPNLYFFLTHYLGYDLKKLPITFFGNKLRFLVPAKEAKCNLTVYSHFGSKTYSNFCPNPDQQPILDVKLKYIETNVSLLIHFFDNRTGEDLAEKKLRIEYQDKTYIVRTNDTGEASYLLQRNESSNLVTVSFWTDFQTKSAERTIVIGGFFPSLLEWLLFWGTIALGLHLLGKFIRRYYK